MNSYTIGVVVGSLVGSLVAFAVLTYVARRFFRPAGAALLAAVMVIVFIVALSPHALIMGTWIGGTMVWLLMAVSSQPAKE